MHLRLDLCELLFKFFFLRDEGHDDDGRFV